MTGMVQDKVVVVTGAGRGIGRGFALLLAAEGARVVVNDIGAGVDGEGVDSSPADEVANLIMERGGEAVVCRDSVDSAKGGERIIEAALDNYNIKNETDEQALGLDLAGLRNSLINADQELSSESSASKFKDLFSIYYKELEESKLIQKAIQAEFKETQDELERVKILRKAARKRYSEAMEEFKNLTKTFWWKASVPLRFLLSSRKERSILRSLYSRTKA